MERVSELLVKSSALPEVMLWKHGAHHARSCQCHGHHAHVFFWSNQDAADFVASAPSNIAATVTPQHMLLNRNSLFTKGLRPHYFCLPILKREKHRELASCCLWLPACLLGVQGNVPTGSGAPLLNTLGHPAIQTFLI